MINTNGIRNILDVLQIRLTNRLDVFEEVYARPQNGNVFQDCTARCPSFPDPVFHAIDKSRPQRLQSRNIVAFEALGRNIATWDFLFLTRNVIDIAPTFVCQLYRIFKRKFHRNPGRSNPIPLPIICSNAIKMNELDTDIEMQIPIARTAQQYPHYQIASAEHSTKCDVAADRCPLLQIVHQSLTVLL
jgi:hypothetical protein